MCAAIARVRALLAAAALLAGAAVRGDDPPPASGGALRVVASPPRLERPGDATADLRVAAPPDVAEVTLTANAGTIEALRRLPGGGFAARWRPPPARVPLVAIVAATAHGARGLEDGWVAIPVSGRGTARVRGEPGAPVTLRIGDRTFGPAVVGKDGVARIAVVVPPGIREAHEGFRPIDLAVPETSLLHAVADRREVLAGREERVRVVAYVVAPHGAGRRGEPPAFEPSRGTVSVSPREPGAYLATWTLPPGPPGEDRLVVRLRSAAESRALVRVAALPGPIAGPAPPLAAAPGAPALRLEARAGPALDPRGRFAAAAGAVAAERPLALGDALGSGLDAALRVEVGALATGRGGVMGDLLAGASLRWAGAGGSIWTASAGAGVLLGRSGAAPAGRLAASVGMARGAIEPFVEASLLAAGGGAPGAFATAGLAVGVRFGMEGRHGHDPDRR